jgi:hypothetical protein
VAETQPATNALAFTRAQATPGQVSLNFANPGSGVTDYALELAPALAPAFDWFHDTNAVLRPIGGGLYEFLTPPPLAPGFYRVVGFAGGQPVTANFTIPSQELEESDGSVRLKLQFSAPFHGMVNYALGGTAGPGDVQPLSGSLLVNGTTATIVITLNDNTTIGQLKYLTLTLQPGAGFQLGARIQSTLTILENDAEWQGSFVTENSTLGFVLKLLRNAGGYTASLKGDGPGFFATNELPAAVAFTRDYFDASVANIPMPASSTLLNLPMNLTLSLSAQNGPTNQSVGATQIQGLGTLVTQVPDKPFLNTTSQGAFLLLRPPVKPPTNEVKLVNAP